MTENEAIILINHTMPKGNSAIDIQLRGALNMAIEALEEKQQFEAIGTVEEFKDLKEKSVAKKAEWKFDDFTAKFGNPYHCSNCDEEFGDTYNYCPNCGCDMYAD